MTSLVRPGPPHARAALGCGQAKATHTMVLTAMKKQVVLVAGLVLVLGVVPSSAIDARLSGSGWDMAIGTTLEVGTY